MYTRKHWTALSTLLVLCTRNTQGTKIDESWLHQSLNAIGHANSRSGPRLTSDLYPEYTVAGRKDWFDFYSYVDLPKFFGIDSYYDAGIQDEGSPLLTGIEFRLSIGKLTGLNLAFGPFEEWSITGNYVYDMGDNRSSWQSVWCIGFGIDIDTGLPIKPSTNVHAEYQWQNYGAANENEWDGYRFEIKYSIPPTNLFGGRLVYNSFTNFGFGSDPAGKSHNNR